MLARWTVLSVLVALSLPLLQGRGKPDTFAIDRYKPYVFLVFDHVGDRKPLSESESRRGLWLRIVNNCRIPIAVDTFELGTGDQGLGVFYDLIPVKPYAAYAGASGEVHGTEGPRNVPQGYYFSNQTVSHTIIPPSGQLLFSVPSNHVQPQWYLKTKFVLDSTAVTAERQPISFVEFHWSDIPERSRDLETPK
jgi:hypothetical protein